jgi:hypothetical protein
MVHRLCGHFCPAKTRIQRLLIGCVQIQLLHPSCESVLGQSLGHS